MVLEYKRLTALPRRGGVVQKCAKEVSSNPFNDNDGNNTNYCVLSAYSFPITMLNALFTFSH